MVSGAIGFTAYVLVYALIESLLLFGLILLLGLLISKKWAKEQRLVTLGIVAMVLSGWSILEQIILVLLYDRFINMLTQLAFLGSSPWIGFMILGLVVAASFTLPIYLVLKSEQITRRLLDLFERVSLLSGFYLVFDVIAIVILIVRNI
jgi:hypothetical protein